MLFILLLFLPGKSVSFAIVDAKCLLNPFFQSLQLIAAYFQEKARLFLMEWLRCVRNNYDNLFYERHGAPGRMVTRQRRDRAVAIVRPVDRYQKPPEGISSHVANKALASIRRTTTATTTVTKSFYTSLAFAYRAESNDARNKDSKKRYDEAKAIWEANMEKYVEDGVAKFIPEMKNREAKKIVKKRKATDSQLHDAQDAFLQKAPSEENTETTEETKQGNRSKSNPKYPARKRRHCEVV